jgi:hypothetical protein
MIGLTDPQLKIIMDVANGVPVERRSVFLERVGAMLALRIHGRDRFVGDDDDGIA